MNPSVRSRALVVEDDKAVSNICRVILERAGFSVSVTGGVKEARSALAAGPYELVVTDVFLKEGHGVELAREIKASSPDTQIVVITGQSTVSTAVAALKTGAHDFIEKPFAPSRLVEAARSALRRREEERASSGRAELERVKAEILARVSHELRTPVSVALLACGMIKARLSGDEQKRLAARLESGVERLKDRVEEIVAFAAAGQEPRLRDADAGALLKEAAALCAAQAAARGATMVLEAPEGLKARCDADKARAALKELLSNAIKFGPRGGEVAASAAAADGGVEWLVGDRGPGVPEAERARVFESFHQVESTLTREAAGLGLGLATARRIAQAHGGRVWLRAREGGGTVAGLFLPAGPLS